MRKRIYLIAVVVLVGGIGTLVRPRSTNIDQAATQALPAQTTQLQVGVTSASAPMATFPSTAMGRIVETHEKVIHYTVQVPVYETHTKDIHYTVTRPVAEAREKEVKYTVMKVVSEEHPQTDGDNAKDRVIKTVKYVPETQVKKVSYTVTTMVQEQRTKKVVYTSCRMVNEKRQKTVQYTTVRHVPAAVLQNELEQAKENAMDPMGSNRCLN